MSCAMPIAALSFLVIILTSVRAQQEPLTLEYASLVFRHGARSPAGTYPNDPWPPESWPQLNWDGARMHYNVGRLVRKRFTVENNLLSPNYTRDEVYVRSTDIDRTLMNVLSQLSGAFPPDEDRKLNGTIDWQPIPLHTVNLQTDNLLLGFLEIFCPRYGQLLELNKESDYYKQLEEQYKDFYDYVEQSTGVDHELNPANIPEISDIVIVEREWGRDPGDWVNDTVASTLQTLYDEDLYLRFSDENSEEKQRLSIGNLIGEIIDRMTKKSQGVDERLVPGTKVVFYSAHDYTVGAFLSALGDFDKKQPPYAATVFVELLSDSSTPKKYYVRTSYLNTNTVDEFDLTDTSTLLVPLSVRGCNWVCPIENYTALLEDLVPMDWHKECAAHRLKSQISGSVEHDDKTKIATLTFSGVHKDASTTCRLSGGPSVKCTNSVSFGVVNSGRYSITVKSVCPDGSSSRKKFKFNVQ